MVKKVAVGLALAAVLAWTAFAGGSEPAQTAQAARAAQAPLTRQPDGTLVLARPGVTEPVLDLYEDFDCPVCRELHRRVNATLLRLADEGRVKVVFHPVTIFRDEPMRSNSVRAAAAARCVPAEQWLAYRDELYGMQPEPHGTAGGFAVEDLVEAGRRVGVRSPGFDACVTRQERAQAHLRDNPSLEGTPTVRLNGMDLGGLAFEPKALAQLVTGMGKRYLES
ncbi:DsbA family protein [Thermoactinospora rubra]|uniref:DsbA family protein n=1 Tax=Thermoactinospora rubra TaxID=1088767 RepID=UPI000A11471C|nr:thioredoxin domain-containing protein [Thermoactinospora rubra]